MEGSSVSVNTTSPLISVGIPCYNRPQELGRLLRQVCNQSYKNLEILVSNNCSTDPSVDSICREAARDDPRVKYYKQTVNIGAGENHNFLLRSASAELFLFLGDDDEIAENYIKELAITIFNSPSASLIGGRGIRYLNGKFWYNYESWISEGLSCFERLSRLLPLAFDQHWIFEHYWYGLFRAKMHPPRLSLDFKSTLHRLFWLSEQGALVHAPGAVYIKHTTSSELHSHRLGSAYRRHKVLAMFRDDHLQSVQQCLPISIQLTSIILRSKNLSLFEKVVLAKRLWSCFAVKCASCEAEPYINRIRIVLKRILSSLPRRLGAAMSMIIKYLSWRF